jgi:hypothetical protein
MLGAEDRQMVEEIRWLLAQLLFPGLNSREEVRVLHKVEALVPGVRESLAKRMQQEVRPHDNRP